MTLGELLTLLLVGSIGSIALTPRKALTMLRTRIADTVRRLLGITPPAPLETVPTDELLSPTPDRYELVLDDTGDYGIRDTHTGLIADYMDGEPDLVRLDVIRLNSDDLDPEDIVYDFEPEEALYPPYAVV